MTTPPTPATIIGGPGSPYVRKVLAVCELKGVPYQLDPIVPFFGDDRFSELNPLRRIPVFMDDEVSVSDSTVICEYLEERYPVAGPAAGRRRPSARGRAGSRSSPTPGIGDVIIWRIFYEAVINPFIWQKPRDKAKIARVVAEDLPEVMGHLEKLAPADGFLFGPVSIADISVAVPFRNLTLGACGARHGALAEGRRLDRAHHRHARAGQSDTHGRQSHPGHAGSAPRDTGRAWRAADGDHGCQRGAAPRPDDRLG